jgi:predicted amidohydrolase YtcJ|tara:strand:+ start:212 stop:463 length:252 start_codon:yes stop_codon:yes gene_type:complete
MNTHVIGASANSWMLKTYKEVLKDSNNKQWRIEHAQIISKEGFNHFDNILPSVQPTRTASYMYWEKDPVGAKKMKVPKHSKNC